MKTFYLLGVAALTLVASSNVLAGQCRDPWVTKAVTEVTHRSPNGSYESGECSIYRYGNGHWRSYQDLVGKVRASFGQTVHSRPIPGLARNQFNAGILRQPSAGVIAAGGGNVIAAGGGNVIAAGGANVIAAGGANVIAAGGANLSGYRVQSASGFNGQCRDPWVTRAVTEVLHRAPNGTANDGECNINRYGNGHWSSYPDLLNKVHAAFGR